MLDELLRISGITQPLWDRLTILIRGNNDCYYTHHLDTRKSSVTMTTTVWLIALLSLLSPVTRAETDRTSSNNIISEGKDLIYNFYSRYNTTQQVDLVFVLDRSGSVPRKGWISTLNFVKDILEHFTVDKDNTRVAIITYSTTVSVDVNDLEPGFYSDRENKCTLNRRIYTYIERKVPHGFTATFAALARAHDLLLRSRPNAKKAVFVVTDGQSNIGPPPVKSAFDILSLKWDQNWDEATLGPQVEIFAFGIDQAYKPELRSIASNMAQHVLSIPNFRLFEQLARSLHGAPSVSMDKQEESWTSASLTNCGTDCSKPYQECMCGTLTGQYACVCSAGYEMHDGSCRPCNINYYKEGAVPIPCQQCPSNTTTDRKGATSKRECALLPGLLRCPPLPDVEHAIKFFVTGSLRNEVMNTGIACNAVTDGNSCHYQCTEGYRLSGSPVMVCNSSGMWEGTLPSCTIIDCSRLKDTPLAVGKAQVVYLNDSTTYGSLVEVFCQSGSVALGSSTWRCDRHGRWTKPDNFMCAEIFCPPPIRGRYMSVSPDKCLSGKQPLGRVCRFTCHPGFQLEGSAAQTCGYQDAPAWLPVGSARCVDVEKPRITCPRDVEVEVPRWGMNYTLVHYDIQKPKISDNSERFFYKIIGPPSGGRFRIGSTPVKYEALDQWGNSASCEQIIHVKEKHVDIVSCPSSITLTANSARRTRIVHWRDPYFAGRGNIMMKHTCTPKNNMEFQSGTHAVVCYPNAFPGVKCEFNVTIVDPLCEIPFKDRPPVGGALICANVSYLYPKTCRIHCKKGFELRYHEPDHQFKCNWDGTWDVNDRWPDCSRSRRAGRALTINEIHVRYEGRCDEKREAIKRAFVASVTRILQSEHPPCKDANRCRITNVKIHCGSRSKRDLTEFAPVEAEWDRGPASMRRVVRRNVAPEDVTDASSADWTGIRIEFEMEGQIHNKSEKHITDMEQKRLLYEMDDLTNAMMSEMESGNYTLVVDGEDVVLRRMHTLVYPELQQNCSEGEVSEFDEYSARCHACPVGSYYVNNTCILCDYGTFQSRQAKLSCRACPRGTNTTILGATNKTDCKHPCSAGFNSSTGYEPCAQCTLSTYQPREGATACLSCPEGMSTVNNGSTQPEDCKEICQAGSFSSTGLAPCTACELGTYQSKPGSKKCLICDRKDTSNPLCPVALNCTDDVPCVHGECGLFNGTVSCLCDSGFKGDSCDTNIDDCASVVCENNGTCQDGVNEATCVCAPGFDGVTCQMEVGECSSSPCYHGYCLNLPGAYVCICKDGYGGTRCQHNLNTCSSQPCVHGNCTDVDDSYVCHCLPGYAGSTCETLVDHCAMISCENGASCNNTPTGPVCVCLPGYTGRLCEDDINECADEPCQNGGECIDELDRFICKCKPGFGGETCQIDVSPDYDLIFSRASTMDFALMRNIPVLHEISVCLWMRTDDVSHYGTIMSYAVSSNWLSADDSNVFTLHDYGSLQLWVNGAVVQTEIALNDGNWQHLCATWKAPTGDWSIYVNGSVVRRGTDLAANTHIEGDGYLVIGQEQDSVGGSFNSRESFVGEITQFNVYDHVLSSDIVRHLSNNSHCNKEHDVAGNVVSWTDVRGRTLGAVNITEHSFCLDVNECNYPRIFTCPKGRRCKDLIGSFECEECQPGKLGCGVDPADVCTHVTCQNQATCIAAEDSMEGGFLCVCLPGTTGRYCEFKLEPCASNPCLNGGTCNPLVDTYECWCPRKGMGDHCETLADRCLSSPCAHGGTCTDEGGEHVTCLCRAGYQGALCLQKVDACAEEPCLNGATCIRSSSGEGDEFQCVCAPGWRGRLCEVIYEPSCERYACLNGGVCALDLTSPRGYVCVCPPARPGVVYGQNCELHTACSLNPCKGNGTCIRLEIVKDDDVGYKCLCAPGYSGFNCEKYSDATGPGVLTTVRPVRNYCANVQCLNGGTCSNRDEGFRCYCPKAFNGVYCDKERQSEMRLYKVVLKLLLTYHPSLEDDQLFRESFRNEIHNVYLEVTKDSKIHVTINSIRKGSVMIDFDLSHTVFLDSDPPDMTLMRSILERQLLNGNIGHYAATLDQFSFTRKDLSTSTFGWVLWLAVGAAVVVFVILVCVIVCICRRRQAAGQRPRKPLNNHRETITLTRINNDMFIQPEPPTPPPRPETFILPKDFDLNGDNLYSDIDLPRPYAMATAAELQNRHNDCREGDSLERRYPSKRGRDVNAESDRSINRSGKSPPEEDGYLAPCNNVRLPGYHEVSSSYPQLSEDAYLTPISDEEAKALERKRNASPGNGNGAFVDDEYLVPDDVRADASDESGSRTSQSMNTTPPPPYRDRYSVTEYAIRNYPPPPEPPL